MNLNCVELPARYFYQLLFFVVCGVAYKVVNGAYAKWGGLISPSVLYGLLCCSVLRGSVYISSLYLHYQCKASNSRSLGLSVHQYSNGLTY